MGEKDDKNKCPAFTFPANDLKELLIIALAF